MNKKPKILVTGANGFIGSHIIKYLSAKNEYEVTGLVRKTSDLFRFGGKKYDLLYASLNESMDKITKGMDVVIHTACKTIDYGEYSDFFMTNVEGTVNILKAAVTNGVKRFIHFSSNVVYGFNGNYYTTENKEKRPFNNAYCKTKTLAEKEVFGFKNKIEIVIIRPTNVFGPFDLTITYPIIKAIEKGLIGWPKGGITLTSPCYVENLVFATERAVLSKTGIGEAYNISDGKDIPWKNYLSLLAERIKCKVPRLYVPSIPLYYSAHFMESIYKLFKVKKPPIITPHLIAYVKHDTSYSVEKANRLLNYHPPFTTEEGVKKSAEWYLEFKETIDKKKGEFALRI